MRLLIFLLLVALFGCSSEKYSGESLVYLKSKDGNFDIYQSDLLGKWERRITDNPGWDWQPKWNTSLNQLVYYSNDTEDNFSVLSRDLKSDQISSLPNSDLLNFQLSPDGQSIYFIEKDGKASNIKRCPINDRSNDEYLTFTSNYNGRFAFDKAGKQMSFISNRDGSNQLYVMDLDSKEIKQLTNGPMIAKYSSFSPNGREIAVTLAEEAEDPIWDIYLIDIKTLESIQLTNTPYSEQEIAWSPSGTKIAFHGTTEADGDQIYTIDIASDKFTKITSGDYYYGEPAWLPFGY